MNTQKRTGLLKAGLTSVAVAIGMTTLPTQPSTASITPCCLKACAKSPEIDRCHSACVTGPDGGCHTPYAGHRSR